MYADPAVDAAFRSAFGLPPSVAAIPASTAPAAALAASATVIPASVVIEYLKGRPSIKDVAVSVQSEYWDWHGVPAPQPEYGGKLSSWFSKAAGSEAVYVEWEKGYDDAGQLQQGCDAATLVLTFALPRAGHTSTQHATSQVRKEGGCQAECLAQAWPELSTCAASRLYKDCTVALGSNRHRRPVCRCCPACPGLCRGPHYRYRLADHAA